MKLDNRFAMVFACLACLIMACTEDKKDDAVNNQPQQPVVVENTSVMCSDNLDNDNNGQIDCQDSGCKDFAFCRQTEAGKENTLSACMDNQDNDEDGKKDCDDEECKAFTICQDGEAENTIGKCQDRLDNDKDGKMDCDDEECQAFAVCQSNTAENTLVACQDGVDNDSNGQTDCNDPQCKAFSICNGDGPQTENTPNDCLDGNDNDNDGKIDCCDEGCKVFAFCANMCPDGGSSHGESTVKECTDGEDNDKDGDVDCLDSECKKLDICTALIGVAENTRELCTDGLDNDYNGKSDKDDANCKLFYAAGGKYGEGSVEACQDGKDNDKDGVMDCSDPECQVYRFCNRDAYDSSDLNCLKAIDEKGADCTANECKDAKMCKTSGVKICPIATDPFKYTKDTCECGETDVDGDCYFNVTDVPAIKNRISSRGAASKIIIKQNIEMGTYTNDPIMNYEGKLNGNHKRITGVINQTALMASDNYYCGLFGRTSKATFRDIDIAITLNCNNRAKPEKTLYAGTLASTLTEGTASNINGSSKIYVEETLQSSSSTEADNRFKYIGGLFGDAEKSTISDVNITGNVSAYLPNYKASTTNRLVIGVGGVAGYCATMTNIEANNYVTLVVGNAITGAKVYKYIGGICGNASTNETTKPVLANVHNQGVVKYHTSGRNTLDSATTIGGIIGLSYSVEYASFNGSIETNNIVGDQQNLMIGGISGYLELTENVGFDSCNVDAYFKVAAENSRIGGIVGQASKISQFVRNCTTKIDLELIPIDMNTSSWYGGIIGYGYAGSNLDNVVYIVNNSARTNYIQSQALSTAHTKYYGGISGYGGAVVNNFASDKLTCTNECSYMPNAIGGAYVYESYWNSDTMGLSSGATNYSDASAEPYTYNLDGIPVTRTHKTVLGLLRYNAGYDGGVISAHIPANTDDLYHNWSTVNDSDGHAIPVPAEE